MSRDSPLMVDDSMGTELSAIRNRLHKSNKQIEGEDYGTIIYRFRKAGINTWY